MKNKEMKLYEKLGVREFRWLAFSLRKVFLYPFTIGMSEAEIATFLIVLIIIIWDIQEI